MKNYDESVKINHYFNWDFISDHPYRILIIGSSRSDKTKTQALLNLIKHQRDLQMCNILFKRQISTWIKVSIAC